jgi:hypothetical protein
LAPFTPAVIATLFLALAGVLVATGAGMLGAERLLPYEVIRPWLDRFAADGSADAYTRTIHLGIVARLRYVGVGLLVAGGLLGVTRGRLAAQAERIWAGRVDLLADGARWVRGVWADMSTAHRAGLLIVLGGGVSLRLGLLDWPMRYDEAFTFLNYAREPLVLGLTKYDLPNNHLFHTALVHVVYRLLGDAPWVVRLPAFLAGVLVMPASYVTIRLLYGRDAALLGTAAVATSMAAIEGSTNARGYSLVTLMFLALVCLGAYLRRTDSVAGWVVFATLGTLSLYTVPTGLYAVAAVGGWLVLAVWAGDVAVSRPRFVRHLVGAVAATALLTGVLYAPILVRTDLSTLLATSPVMVTKVKPIAVSEFLAGNAEKIVETWQRWASDRSPWLQALWVTGIAVALLWHHRVGRSRVPFVAGILLGCSPILLLQRVVPPARVWVFLLPVFAGMGAAGVLHLSGCARARWPRVFDAHVLAIALALVLATEGALSLPARSRAYRPNLAEFPGVERAVSVIAPQLVPGDKILVLGMARTPLLYHARRQGLPYLTYVYDYVLEGWSPLQGARRVFIVVNHDALDRRGDTLARVLADSGLAGGPTPVEIAVVEAGRVYLRSATP